VRPEDIGQLGNRFREQARSHRKQKQDQQIAAFGSSYSWNGCMQLLIGWLSGRHRWQASSHRRQDQDQKIAAFGSSCIWIALGFG
jgi:hypothetical protein